MDAEFVSLYVCQERCPVEPRWVNDWFFYRITLGETLQHTLLSCNKVDTIYELHQTKLVESKHNIFRKD